jgi:lysozyme
MQEDWLFWQFRKTSVSGIKGNVDVNIYNGDVQQLKLLPLNNVSVVRY